MRRGEGLLDPHYYAQEMILRSILDYRIQSPENGLMDLNISWELTTLKAI